ncbi:MAG TPA: aspartate carbamoyltransferase catalytic subunit [Acidimicrobiales bacterium]|nr:aspartate carbamoyltransferase catalytic subunit [Acidimicrobiales bacterium]
MSPFPTHLLSIDDLGTEEIAEVLSVADSFAEVGRRANPKVPTLRGRTVATLFFEDSTRTRMSFETAAKRMSADVLSFAAGSSSVKKGESLRDTVETIEAIGIDAVIIRHASSGVPARVAGWVDRCVVINAGDGWHQHPTQALLDLYTVRQAFGGGDAGLARFDGLQVVIVGDIRHSRVARSQITAYAAMGAEVTLVAPSTLLPPSLEGWPVAAVSPHLDDVLEKADVVSLLRVQSERGSGEFVPTLREYTAGYGLTSRRAAMLRPEALILHPGPIVRGVEIASDVAELPASLITAQVSNGVAIRMAVLFLLLGQGPAGGGHRG